jgi:prepilin-type N-terminal cleavage/methylation domain-containing protein
MKGLVLNNSKWPKTPAPQGVRSGGFTLIELLVTLAMVSIVMAAIGSVYAGLTRSYTTQNVAADVQQTMRAAIDFVVEDIMMAGLDPLETADAEFEAADSFSMQFTSDRDMDGEIKDVVDFERIIYQYDDVGDTLFYKKLAADPLEPLIDNVRDLRFVYLDADGNDLGNPVDPANYDDIRTVVISMRVEEPAGRGGTVVRTYMTQVRCRNLGI